MLTRRLLLATLALGLSAGAASAATRTVSQLDGRVTAKTYLKLEKFVSRNVDRVVGLKLTVKRSGSGDALIAEETGDRLVMLLTGRKEPKSEVLITEGYEDRSGDYIMDGFFLVKYGGFRQGTHSYALTPVDEAKVRLNPRIKIVNTRLK